MPKYLVTFIWEGMSEHLVEADSRDEAVSLAEVEVVGADVEVDISDTEVEEVH